MAEKKYIAVIAIDGFKDGKRHEYAPGDPITFDDEDDQDKLLAAEAIREASEGEAALIEKRERALSASRTNAPVKRQTEPREPNGPGGASGESDKDGGGGSVASDTNTVGAGSQGDKDSSLSQDNDGDEDGDEDENKAPVAKTTSTKTSGEKTPAKGKTAAKGKTRDNDLA